MRHFASYFSLALLLSTSISLMGEGRELEVLIRAWADPGYIREVDATGTASAESCTFYRGTYYASPYEEIAIPFEQVATILREHLEGQNYTMAAEPATADLLLVVNWGQTAPEDPEVDSGFGSDDETTGGGLSHMETNSEREKAELIGANQLFKMHPGLLKRRMLEEAVRQERYFINVVAYSLSEIRSRPEKERLPDAKWITVMSVPSKRVDPEHGFAVMSKTAAAYFGRNLADLTFFREGEKQGIVTIGETRFLEFIDDEGETSVPQFQAQE